MMNNKKAQHEMVGFVIIVVIVVIIGLFLLSFNIGGEENRISAEVSHLLESSMHITSECAVSFVPQYKDIGDLIKSCYRNERCLDGRNSCDVLNSSFESILDDSLNVGDGGVNKGYKLGIYYKDPGIDSPREVLLEKSKGVNEGCSSLIGGSQSLLVSSLGSGIISTELEICKG